VNNTIINKCNYALNHFGFVSELSRVVPNTLNFTDPNTTNGYTSITTSVKTGICGNTSNTNWHYLHLKSHKDWLFLFGRVNSKRVYKWNDQPKKKSRTQSQVIDEVVKHLAVKMSAENALKEVEKC
jgi:hypothetical protein